MPFLPASPTHSFPDCFLSPFRFGLVNSTLQEAPRLWPHLRARRCSSESPLATHSSSSHWPHLLFFLD
jgi:hypothetical protein